jgi:hypothetical protein
MEWDKKKYTFRLENDEFFLNEESQRIQAPVSGKIISQGGKYYAEIQSVRYLVDISRPSQFPDLVAQTVKNTRASEADRNSQNDLQFLKDIEEEKRRKEK